MKELKARHPHVPVIGFPRGAGANAQRYVGATGVEGIGCDTTMPLERHARAAQPMASPCRAISIRCCWSSGGPALKARVAATLAAMHGVPFIFNLGHGIVPQTPPEHVAELVALVRGEGG